MVFFPLFEGNFFKISRMLHLHAAYALMPISNQKSSLALKKSGFFQNSFFKNGFFN
jgi:hypothetical protein